MKKYKYVRLGFSGDSIEVDGKLLHVNHSPLTDDLNRLGRGPHPVRETVMTWYFWRFFWRCSYPYVLILLEKGNGRIASSESAAAVRHREGAGQAGGEATLPWLVMNCRNEVKEELMAYIRLAFVALMFLPIACAKKLDSAEAYIERGMTSADKDEFDKAIEDFSEAISNRNIRRHERNRLLEPRQGI